MMNKLENILKEIKDVPDNRLEEPFQFVQSLTPNAMTTESKQKKILSFAGAFSDMENSDYEKFINQTKVIRKTLFNRNLKLCNHPCWILMNSRT